MKSVFLLLFLSSLSLFSESKIEDSWEILLLDGRRVGTAHIQVFQNPDGTVRSEILQRLIVDRGGQRFLITEKSSWLEDDGLRSLNAVINTNGDLLRLRAERTQHGLTLTRERKSRQNQVLLEGNPGVGPFGAARLLRQCFTRGQKTLTYSMLSPETGTIERIDIAILGPGEMRDSGGRLHKGILAEEHSSALPGLTTSVVLDRGGDVLYARSPVGVLLEVIAVEQEPLPTSEPAVYDRDRALFDVTSLFIPVTSPDGESTIGLPGDLQPLGVDLQGLSSLAVRFEGPALDTLEPALRSAGRDLGESKYRVIREGDSLILCIDRAMASPGQSLVDIARAAVGDPALDSYLRDGFHLNLDDTRLVPLLSGGTAPALQRAVYDYIRDKNTGYGFAGTDEILDSRAGDCTEHSVLLISLLRRMGVPARMAYGFVLTGQGFGGHAWVEIYAQEHWFWLDPLFPEQSARLRLGVIDPADPVWAQLDLSLLTVAAGVVAEIEDAKLKESLCAP